MTCDQTTPLTCAVGSAFDETGDVSPGAAAADRAGAADSSDAARATPATPAKARRREGWVDPMGVPRVGRKNGSGKPRGCGHHTHITRSGESPPAREYRCVGFCPPNW